MSAPKKTRERILDASLELFNEQGARSITTNHIAAHLGISPGNLYYHFGSKQAIVAQLFQIYCERLKQHLQVPAERALTIADKALYLESLLAAVWEYRFVHRDLEHLLACDEALAEAYRAFAKECLQRAEQVYQGFVDSEILLLPEDGEVAALALNAWIIITSWVHFLCSMGGGAEALSHAGLQRGIYQILTLERAYIAPAHREAFNALQARLYVDFARII